MAKERMTVVQLVDILGILWKMLLGQEVEWKRVSCKTAQGILEGDHVKFVRHFIRFLAAGAPAIMGVLKKRATTTVPGAERLVVSDALKEANVGYMDDNFKTFFFGKLDKDVGSAQLAVYELEEESSGPEIFCELGIKADVYLTHILGLIKQQARGQEGHLVVDGSLNMIHSMGTDNQVWRLSAWWCKHQNYWHIFADPIESEKVFSVGHRVIAVD